MSTVISGFPSITVIEVEVTCNRVTCNRVTCNREVSRKIEVISHFVVKENSLLGTHKVAAIERWPNCIDWISLHWNGCRLSLRNGMATAMNLDPLKVYENACSTARGDRSGVSAD